MPAKPSARRKPLLGRERPGYLFPFACFACRVAFRRPWPPKSSSIRKCPSCAGPAVALSRKFKPPARSDLAQWRKVEFLVRHGFVFQSVPAAYPKTLREAQAFVEKYRRYAIRRPD